MLDGAYQKQASDGKHSRIKIFLLNKIIIICKPTQESMGSLSYKIEIAITKEVIMVCILLWLGYKRITDNKITVKLANIDIDYILL